MDITSAKYFKISYEDASDKTVIQAVIDGRNVSIPMTSDNRHYTELQKWSADGNTIEEAE